MGNRCKVAAIAVLVALGLLLTGLSPGSVSRFDLKRLTNSVGMRFVLVPAGTFRMGSPISEKGRDDDEAPHRVTLSQPFYLQSTEVTQGQWRQVMGENPSAFRDCGDDCPVESVAWYHVQAFIRRLNAKEGTEKYRLPTEAEWEYACRAGSLTAYCFGNDPGMLGRYAWYLGNASQNTHPVALLMPNAWGLHDMHGNVGEWCRDWYDRYPGGHAIDPTGPSTGEHRVIRGGSCLISAPFTRSAFRDSNHPALVSIKVGFRVARDF